MQPLLSRLRLRAAASRANKSAFSSERAGEGSPVKRDVGKGTVGRKGMFLCADAANSDGFKTSSRDTGLQPVQAAQNVGKPSFSTF